MHRCGSVSLMLQAMHVNPAFPPFPMLPPLPHQGTLLAIHIFLSDTGDEDLLWGQGKPGQHALGPDPDPVRQHKHRGQQQAAADAAEQWIGEIALPKVSIKIRLRGADSGGSHHGC